MIKRILRFLVRLALLAAALLAGRAAYKRWVDGPEPADRAPSGPLRPAGGTGERSAPPAGPAAPAGPEAVADVEAPAPAVAPTRPVPPPRPATAAPARVRPLRAQRIERPSRSDSPGPAVWIKPGADGDVPGTHPVKVKMGSRTYRVPGMTAYDSTRPDRCYPSADAAEADGFTRAKR